MLNQYFANVKNAIGDTHNRDIIKHNNAELIEYLKTYLIYKNCGITCELKTKPKFRNLQSGGVIDEKVQKDIDKISGAINLYNELTAIINDIQQKLDSSPDNIKIKEQLTEILNIIDKYIKAPN